MLLFNRQEPSDEQKRILELVRGSISPTLSDPGPDTDMSKPRGMVKQPEPQRRKNSENFW